MFVTAAQNKTNPIKNGSIIICAKWLNIYPQEIGHFILKRVCSLLVNLGGRRVAACGWLWSSERSVIWNPLKSSNVWCEWGSCLRCVQVCVLCFSTWLVSSGCICASIHQLFLWTKLHVNTSEIQNMFKLFPVCQAC